MQSLLFWIFGIIALAAIGVTVLFLNAQRYIANDLALAKAEAIVVAGCPALADGTASLCIRIRMDKAIELWRAGLAPKMLVTGGAVLNAYPEAEVMAKYARTEGVPGDALMVEPRARNTRENAKFGAKLLKEINISRIIAVTSLYHSGRVKRLFKTQGLDVQIVATPYPPETRFLERLHDVVHETGAMILAR